MKKFGSLGAAAAYCEDVGCAYDDIFEKGGRFVVVERAKKLKPNKAPAPPKSRAKRKRPKKDETRAERQTRLDDLALLREDYKDSKERNADARKERAASLGEIKKDCGAKRKRTTRDCKTRRDGARKRAREVKASERKKRGDARASYTKRRKMTPKERAGSGLRYAKSESDSIAEHAIPDRLHGVWRDVAYDFPYDLAPDRRAELFMEWYREDRANIDAALWEEEEGIWTDEALARAEATRGADDLPF